VDRVTVKGSEVPIDIYTYDALQDQEWKMEKKKVDNAAKGKMLKMLGLSADAAILDMPAAGAGGSRGSIDNSTHSKSRAESFYARVNEVGVVAALGALLGGGRAGRAGTPPRPPAVQNSPPGGHSPQGSSKAQAQARGSSAPSPLMLGKDPVADALREVADRFGGGGGGSELSRPNSARVPFSGDGLTRSTSFRRSGKLDSTEDLAVARPKTRGGLTGQSVMSTRPSAVQPGFGGTTASRRPSNVSALLTTFTVDSETALVFERDPDLRQLRAHVTFEFREQFETGLVHYLSGEWGFAREELEKANQMMKDKVPALGGDGPSLALLRYMDQYEYTAPNNWMNYRPLTSK
jgi:hypothetical protein